MAPAHLVPLNQGVLTLDDIGGDWAAQTPLTPLAADQLTSGPCGSPLWAHDQIGYRAVFDEGTGTVPNTLTSEIREAATDNQIISQAAFVASSTYAECLKAEAQVGLTSSGLSVDSLALDPLPLEPSSTDNEGFVITAHVVDAAGNAADISIDHVEMFSARYEATLDLQTVTGSGVDRASVLATQTSREVQRLALLPPEGTLNGETTN